MSPHDKRHLLDLLKKLLSELPNTHTPSDTQPIHENKSTPDGERKPNEETRNPNISVPATFSPPNPQVPPDHYNVTCKIEKSWWDERKPIVEVAGVIILAIYTIFTALMYCANKQAANAAESAATTARLAFMSDQWPYTVPTQIEFAGNQRIGPVVVNIKFQNIGKSPACNVTTYRKLAYLEYADLSQDQANAKREDFFNQARSEANKRQKSDLAPTRDVMVSTQEEVILTPGKIALITDHKAGLALVGGVIYDDVFKVTHETQLCMFIEGKDFPIWHYCDVHNSIK